MEYVNDTPMTTGDISPVQMGRMNPDPSDGHKENGCGCGCGHSHGNDCGCGQLPACGQEGSKCTDGWGLANHPLAMVYAPCQGFHSLYDFDTALVRGTLFSELDLPLEAVGGNGSVSGCGACGSASRNRHM